MRTLLTTLTLGLALAWLAPAAARADDGCAPLLDFQVATLVDHKPVRLCRAYRGKAVLIVNTASYCGFTPQYKGLERLYGDYRDRGLVVLGFPSNDFGNQEPGSEASVRDFCTMTYHVRFPMFAKSDVRGDHAIPLYRALAGASGEYPSWNFHKYLLDRHGRLVGSFPSAMSPDDPKLVAAIRRALR